MSSESRAREYMKLIEDIIAEDAALTARGLPGLDEFEVMEMRDMLSRIERDIIANMPDGVEDLVRHLESGFSPGSV